MKVLLAFIVLFAQSASAQFLIHGKILDSKSKEPLAYAPVAFKNENKGTLTNNDGYFEIKSNTSHAKLQISYLGYETKFVDFTLDKTIKDTIIYLTPKVFTLNEVVISPERLESLIKALYDKYRKTKSIKYFADAFYRDFSTIDNIAVNASEIFYKVTINQSGIGKWNFIQGRSAEAKTVVEKPSVDYLFTSIVNNSSFIRNFPLTKFSPAPMKEDLNAVCILPICEDPKNNYSYQRVGEKIIDNKKVSVITFTPHMNNSNFLFTGKMEIIEEDLQVIYLEIELFSNMFFSRLINVPYLNQRGQYIDGCFFRHVWHYNKLNNDWILERIENILKFRVRLKRDKNYEKINCTTSQIYFYNFTKRDQSRKGKQTIIENDRKLIRENNYDFDFWQNNSKVITEIPFEKNIRESFLKSGFYGNIFPGSIETEHYKQCSDLENKVIKRLNENYYAIFKRFVIHYYFGPENEVCSFFQSEVFPFYRTYINQIINHNIPVEQLYALNKYINEMSNYPTVSDILNLWAEMSPQMKEDMGMKLDQLLRANIKSTGSAK